MPTTSKPSPRPGTTHLFLLACAALAACKGSASRSGPHADATSVVAAHGAAPTTVTTSTPSATDTTQRIPASGGGMVGIHDAPAPRHVAHDPATDKPVVHPLRDLYQEDQHFSNLFGKGGKSEICGPTTMSNVMLYLKHQHAPTYDKLLGHIKDSDQNAHDAVEAMFKLCHTDKNTGTSASQLKGCAEAAFKQAGYSALILKDVGVFSPDAAQKHPITPGDLRAEAKSTWKQGEPLERSDHGAVLLFGWYDRATYKRTGGHFVALAGYDDVSPNVVYVTNPLIKDYPKDHVYSKVVMEKIAAKKGDLATTGMWQTEHLFGDNAKVIAVLEEMVAVLPKR